MACFIVPATEAIITTAAKGVLKHHEEKTGEKIKFHLSEKIGWLNKMLWGGSALLAFEHIWHGEVTPWFPFLTASSNPADAAEMLHEMATSGVAMAALVTAVWACMVGISAAAEKRKGSANAAAGGQS
ncbi:MAG: hypothetical protein ACI4XA_08255 [Oscillospiraceae bacterium]